MQAVVAAVQDIPGQPWIDSHSCCTFVRRGVLPQFLRQLTAHAHLRSHPLAWQMVQCRLGLQEGVGADHEDFSEGGGPSFHGTGAPTASAAGCWRTS